VAIGASEQLSGQVKCSGAEQKEHEDLLLAKRVVDVPSNLQARWVYDGSNNCIYAAYGPRGLAESSPGWLIQKFTYTGSNCTKREIAYDSYTNYLTATYA